MLRKDVLHGPIDSDGVRDWNDVDHEDHDINHDIHNARQWSLFKTEMQTRRKGVDE